MIILVVVLTAVVAAAAAAVVVDSIAASSLLLWHGRLLEEMTWIGQHFALRCVFAVRRVLGKNVEHGANALCVLRARSP